MERETLVTAAGLVKLQEEFARLSTTGREEIAERIKVAREYGDISENAEYDDAKNEQARLESRIQQLEEKLRTVKVIADVDGKTASIGTTVTVIDKSSGDEEQYTIVGSTEADPLENLVSNESPVGKALVGRKKGETVEVQVPAGTITFEIKKIAVAK